MTNDLKKHAKNIFDYLTKDIRDDFNKKVLDVTYKAQKNMASKWILVYTLLGTMKLMHLSMHIYRGI